MRLVWLVVDLHRRRYRDRSSVHDTMNTCEDLAVLFGPSFISSIGMMRQNPAQKKLTGARKKQKRRINLSGFIEKQWGFDSQTARCLSRAVVPRRSPHGSSSRGLAGPQAARLDCFRGNSQTALSEPRVFA